MLAIEASNPSADPDPGCASVAGALVEGDGPSLTLGPIVEVPFQAASRDSDGLLPAIDAVCAQLGTSPLGLTRVCVSEGPGGYTGLRVSVTVARSIAMATGAEVAGVPSAVVALGAWGGERSGERAAGRPAVVCLASKGARTHATAFTEGGPPDGEPVGVLDADEVLGLCTQLGCSLLIADRFLPEPIRTACIQNSVEVCRPLFSASTCLLVGSGRDSSDLYSLKPVYAREPEAVRLWRVRENSGN